MRRLLDVLELRLLNVLELGLGNGLGDDLAGRSKGGEGKSERRALSSVGMHDGIVWRVGGDRLSDSGRWFWVLGGRIMEGVDLCNRRLIIDVHVSNAVAQGGVLRPIDGRILDGNI